MKSAEVITLPDLGEIIADTSVALDRQPFALWHDTAWRRPQIQVDTDDWLIENVDYLPQTAVVRLWSNRPCVVVSRRDSNWPGFSCALQKLKEAGFSIAIRRTGGTAVIHTPGVLNFTLCYRVPDSRTFSVAESYGRMNTPIIQFLESLDILSQVGEVPGAYCSGRYDILASGKKLAGTAQRVKRDARGSIVLSHLSLNVSNSPGKAEEAIKTFYRACQRPVEVEGGLTTSVNSLLTVAGGFSSARSLAIALVNYLGGRQITSKLT